MYWFKHMSNMRNDTKIKRLIKKYGLEGYGLYCLIIESITEKLTNETPEPSLEETCEDIASFYNGDTAKVNEMACFMLNQGLIEIDEISSKITCHKIYKYLQQSSTSSEKLRKMIKSYSESQQVVTASQTVVTESQQVVNRIEEKRIEKNRKEEEEKKEPFGDLKKTYNEFLLNYFSQDVINKIIWQVKKERENHNNLLSKFNSVDDIKEFLLKAQDDKWIKDKGFIPSILNSQYSSIISKLSIKSKNQLKGVAGL